MPQELIDKFIDDLWFEGDTDTVKTLSQTSRLFLHRCRRHLFSYIRLSSESSTRQSQRVARKAKNLDDVLVRIPEIANYVQRLFLEIPRYKVARAHIISRLLLRLSMINEFHVDGTPTFSDWTLFPPELQSVISHLAYSPRMKIFNLHGIYNFPISFFTSCTNITDLSIRRCGLEDHASLGNLETRSIARLHTYLGTLWNKCWSREADLWQEPGWLSHSRCFSSSGVTHLYTRGTACSSRDI